MTEIVLYNSLTRKKEPFKPMRKGEVRIYTCGPTVYHYVHIGNLRTFLFEDLLRRTFKYFGYKVTQVMNLTDVDDKTIKGALAKKITLEAFTEPYIQAFFDDLKTLGVDPAEHYPKATQYIPQMVAMIERLLEKKVAYQGQDGSIYFSIHQFPHYGCLSHLKLDELKAGASERVAADEYEKENVSDFVLWKAYDEARDGAIFWESPFGKGRPGWHLECSVMAMQILGETIDIHVGGVDNMFPHHENEIAQSEAYSGKPFVHLWMHAEHLIVDGKKMSKSLGNFYTLRDLVQKGYKGTSIRYLLLQTHYKTQLNFTLAGIEAAQGALQRLQDFIYRLQHYQEMALDPREDLILNAEKAFSEALADDLNISAALAALFDFVRECNLLMDQKAISREGAKKALQFLKKCNEVLGVLSLEVQTDGVPQHVQQLFQDRLKAREEKNWQLADALRVKIAENGYLIEDSPQGARLKKQ